MKIKVISNVEHEYVVEVVKLLNEIMPGIEEAAKYLSGLAITPTEILIIPNFSDKKKTVYCIEIYMHTNKGEAMSSAIKIEYFNLGIEEKKRLKKSSELSLDMIQKWAEHICELLQDERSRSVGMNAM